MGSRPDRDDVLDLVRAHGGVADPVTRQRLAALYIESEVLRLIRLRTVSATVRGHGAGARGQRAQGARRRARPARDGDGRSSSRAPTACSAAQGPCGEGGGGMWTYGYLYARALTIGGGTSEVQRNILGERVLGLPRD